MPEEFRYHLSQPVIDKDCDPLHFWKQQPCLTLSDLALKHLTALAILVASERLFSNAGNILIPNRSSTTPQHFQELLFLSSIELEKWHL